MRGRGLSELLRVACVRRRGKLVGERSSSANGIDPCLVLYALSVSVTGHRASTRVKNNIPFLSYQILYQAARSSVAAMMAVTLAAYRISR